MNYIKFIRIFLLVLIIIGIGLLATKKMWVPKVVEMILKSENKNEPAPKVSNNKDETINWKTYTNVQNGFEIQYPKNWSQDWLEYPEYNKALFNAKGDNNKFSISFNDSGDLPIDIKYEGSSVKIAGKESTRKTYTGEASVGAKDKYLVYTSFCYYDCKKYMPNTNYINMIFTLYCPIIKNTEQEKNNCNNLFDSIVSTFKFTK